MSYKYDSTSLYTSFEVFNPLLKREKSSYQVGEFEKYCSFTSINESVLLIDDNLIGNVFSIIFELGVILAKEVKK